jgi:hypothetical protein
MLKGGFYVFSNIKDKPKDRRYHDLANFEEMLNTLNIEYKTILPDKFSAKARDINGISIIEVKGYNISFDSGNRFITIKKIES